MTCLYVQWAQKVDHCRQLAGCIMKSLIFEIRKRAPGTNHSEQGLACIARKVDHCRQLAGCVKRSHFENKVCVPGIWHYFDCYKVPAALNQTAALNQSSKQLRYDSGLQKEHSLRSGKSYFLNAFAWLKQLKCQQKTSSIYARASRETAKKKKKKNLDSCHRYTMHNVVNCFESYSNVTSNTGQGEHATIIHRLLNKFFKTRKVRITTLTFFCPNDDWNTNLKLKCQQTEFVLLTKIFLLMQEAAEKPLKKKLGSCHGYRM